MKRIFIILLLLAICSNSYAFNIKDSGSSGTGDVTGPASSTDNAIVRYDGATGKIIQDTSSTLIDDSGKIAQTSTLNAATGNEVAYTLNYTTDKATSGNDTGLLINMTDTLSPGTSLGLHCTRGANTVLAVDMGNTKVGIGTATLTGALTILSSATNMITMTSPSIRTWNIDVSTGVFKIKDNDGTGGYPIPFLAEFGDGSYSTGIYIKNNGNTGIGTTSPDRLLHVEKASALTNTIQQVTRLTHITSGVPANNIGLGLEFEQETSAGNNEVIATIEAVVTDVTATSEDADLVFKTMDAGAIANEKLRISSLGAIIVPTTIITPGTTGDQTINKLAGRVNIAASGTSVTITNSLVTANSIIVATAATNDTTGTVKNVVASAGSFVINVVAVTAETAFNWIVISQ